MTFGCATSRKTITPLPKQPQAAAPTYYFYGVTSDADRFIFLGAHNAPLWHEELDGLRRALEYNCIIKTDCPIPNGKVVWQFNQRIGFTEDTVTHVKIAP